MAKIFLSVPILEKPEFKMIYSVYQAILSCREHQVRLYINEGDSLVSRIRCVHMSVFLHEYPDYDYFCSIDSDIEIVNCFATNNILKKLIDHNLDFVGGLYALKQFNNEPQCSSIPLDPTINRSNISFNKGLLEMMWLSSGCWMIKRSVIEKMVAAYPEKTYVGDDNVAGKTIHGLCLPEVCEIKGSNGEVFKKLLSEDWNFCQKWRDIGGKIYADTSIVLRHIGKIPYNLWNVEVVTKKKEDVPTAISTNPTQIIPNKVNIPNSLPNLPPAGFDLENLKTLKSLNLDVQKEK